MKNKVKYIIKLLSDPDESVYISLKKQLKKSQNPETLFYEAIPKLSYNEKILIKNFLSDIFFEQAYDFFSNWKRNPDKDLLEPLFWLEKIYYPFTKLSEIKQKLNNLINFIKVDITNLSPLEQVNVINRIIYSGLGLHSIIGLRKVEDFFINKVLENKASGLDFSIAFYILIANLLKVEITPFKGIENLFLGYVDFTGNPKQKNVFKPKIKFVINPYYKGEITSFSVFDRSIAKEKIKNTNFYDIVDNLEIITRITQDIRSILFSKNNEMFEFYQKIYFLLKEKN